MKKHPDFNMFYKIFISIIVLFIPLYAFSQEISEAGSPFGLTQGNEFDPAFSSDGLQLAFISDKSGQFKIYISSFQDNHWSDPTEIEAINNFNSGKGNIRYPSFNYNGTVLYFCADYYSDSTNFDIFYSKKDGNNWSEPINIGEPVNTSQYDGQPSISPDDKSLYFVRNTKSQMFPDADCKKIYISNRNPDGEWNKAEALPIPINVECEQTPKIALDNKSLFFASMREGGKGGFDIYKTKLIAKNVWIPAESLDTINTSNNEFSPTQYYDNSLAFFQVEKSEKRISISKIYKTNIQPQFFPDKNIKFSGKVKDLSSGKAIDAEISVYDPVTSRLQMKFNTEPKTGDYLYFLPTGNNYIIDYSKTGYSHNFIHFAAKDISENKQINTDINLYNHINLILNVFDNEIFRPVNAQIEVKNSKKQIVNLKSKTLETGRFKIEIPIGEKYQFTLQADFFETKTFEFDLTGIVQFDEFEIDEELVSKKVDFQIDIADEESQAGLPVDVVITNLDNNEVIKTTAIANSDGKYVVKLREGDRYNISVSPKGYSYYSTTVDLKKKEAPKKLEVKLKQLKEDTKLTLNNITFEVNSAEIKQSSYDELDRVVKLMENNPSMNIEISAHTDNVGSDVYNLRLSKRRAMAVMDYLFDKKIGTDRIISKGYGKTKPIVPNDTEENKALNRRVEMKIIKIE